MNDTQTASIDPSVSEQLTLIRQDYDQSMKFIDGVVRISSTIRQTSMTAAVALIGLAIQSHSAALAVAAAVLGVLMGSYDANHGWIYGEIRTRVSSMEDIFRAEKAARSRPEDEAVATTLSDQVDDFRIGAVTTMPTFTVRSLASAKPGFMYLIYPAIVVGGAAVAAHYW